MTEHNEHRHFKIIINATEHTVHKQELSYQKIVDIAFPGSGTDSTTIYTITYEHSAQPHKPDGVLPKGGEIHIKNGTVFSVSPTGQS